MKLKKEKKNVIKRNVLFYTSGCVQKALKLMYLFKNSSSHNSLTFKPNNIYLNKTWLEPQ